MRTAISARDKETPYVSSETAISLSAARRYCRALAERHYENFTVVSWLLPRNLHQHFHNVYAYCRWADDLGDEITGTESRYDDDSRRRSLALLAWWRSQLLRCYAQGPACEDDASAAPLAAVEILKQAGVAPTGLHPVMVALRDTIRTFTIPPAPFLNLITAFEQDQRVPEYDTYEQLLGYCRNSANPVGRLVLYLCRTHNEESARLSDCVCTGLQLTNFWQDVARDLQRGRIYLPRADCQQFGYHPDQLSRREYNAAFRDLMQHQVNRARALLLQGRPLIRRVPATVQVDIDLFIQGGLAILKKIRAMDYNVWQRRPVLTKWDQVRLFGRCAGRHLWNRCLSRVRGLRRGPSPPSPPEPARRAAPDAPSRRIQPQTTPITPPHGRP